MDFNLSIPIKVISGKGVLKKNSFLLRQFGSKCLVVTGGSSAVLSGALDDVRAALGDCEIEYKVFDKIGPNPLISACHEAGKLANDFGAEFIIGIGGGSPLDGAKAAAVYAANPKFAPIDIYTPADERNKALPTVLIGTTAGTGSEVGRVSVLTNGETGRKKSISSDDLYPVLTFADSTYTQSMPYKITVSTALDALSHATEGYFSNKCGDIPTMFAEKAIPMIWEGLCQLEKTKAVPDEAMREQLYYGSLYAGITLAYCGTAFPHPLGYVLTENYGTPHGTACAAFMPELFLRAEKFESKKTARLMSIMGTDIEQFCKIISSLTDCGDIAMSEDEIEKYCSRWDAAIPNNFKFSPGGFTKEEAVKMFRSKYLK